MRKKKLTAVLLLVAVLLLAGNSIYAQETIKMLFNGKEISSDPPAAIVQNRVMVPLRVVSETLGAKVSWDEYSRTVSISKPEEMKLVKINGEATTWPYWVIDGKVYMEYRNAIQLVREGYKHPEYQIVFFPSNSTLSINGRSIPFSFHKQGEYNLVNINYLMDLGILRFEWDEQTANFVSIPL